MIRNSLSTTQKVAVNKTHYSFKIFVIFFSRGTILGAIWLPAKLHKSWQNRFYTINRASSHLWKKFKFLFISEFLDVSTRQILSPWQISGMLLFKSFTFQKGILWITWVALRSNVSLSRYMAKKLFDILVERETDGCLPDIS